VPIRQQTLRATLAWSYELLDPAEQRLFRRLGVFVGGWTLEAVEGVCDLDGDLELDALDGIGSLLNKSLLQQREGADGAARFYMLETIREYALEQLAASGDLEPIRWKHADFFITLAEAAIPELIGPQQVMWMNHLEIEHPNLRAVLVWSLEIEDNRQPKTNNEQRTELGLSLAVALSQFWSRHGYLSEGRRWLVQALSRTEIEAASSQATEAYRAQRAKALRRLGTLAVWQGDLAAAQPAYEESLALYRGLGDRVGIADVLGHFGMLFEAQSELGQAAILLEESLSIYRDLGEARGIAGCLFFLGTLAYIQGNYRSADALWEESLLQQRANGDMYGVAMVLAHCGMVALDQGDNLRAGAHVAESLSLQRELGDRWQIALTLELSAGLAAAAGQQPDDAQSGGLRAARLFGAAEALREILGAPILPHNQEYYQRRVAAARAQFDEATFAAAWAAGRAMTLDQAITEALAISGSSER
jgi:tetratricopeptide (TPR) repeat protein